MADGDPPSRLDLSSLIEALNALFLQISRRLLGHRLESHASSTDGGKSVDISYALNDHLKRVAAAAPKRADENQERAETPGAAKMSEPSASQPVESSGRSLLSGLSERLGRMGRRLSVQPHMGEKMQASTMDHINKALHLARQGNAQGAIMHTKLAESAMRTASEYMPEEAYEGFKEKVETKIAAILKTD